MAERKRFIHTLIIPSPDGSPLEVTYEEWAFGHEPFLGYSSDHFELHGKCISPTGYRSHFVQSQQVGNPVEYAKNLVAELFAERVKEGYKAGQVTLFA